MKGRLLEVERARKVLDGHAAHAAGCPTIWEADGACDCGLTAARARRREAVLELLTHYAVHDAGPWSHGGKCGCALDRARRQPQALAWTPSPNVTGDSLLLPEV